MPMTVRQYMTTSPHWVAPWDNIERAYSLILDYRIRHLPVVEEDVVIGVLSERDLHIAKSLRGIDPADVTVRETMSSPAFVVSPDMPIEEAARALWERRLGSAVVVEGGKLRGIFTTTDALRALVDAQDRNARELAATEAL